MPFSQLIDLDVFGDPLLPQPRTLLIVSDPGKRLGRLGTGGDSTADCFYGPTIEALRDLIKKPVLYRP